MEKISKTKLKEIIDDVLLKCDSYDRFAGFLELDWNYDLKGDMFWYALKETYSTCDNLYGFKDNIKQAFSSEEPSREKLMSKKEQKYLSTLPENLTIYRGMTVQEFESGDFGVSWTLRKDVAEFFAYKYCRNQATAHLPKMVHELPIKKSDIIAYFGERKEFEVIYMQPIHKK